jgi:hypothetical protein
VNVLKSPGASPRLFMLGNRPPGIWYTDKEWFYLSPRPRGINVLYLSAIRSFLSTPPDVCIIHKLFPVLLPKLEVLPKTK